MQMLSISRSLSSFETSPMSPGLDQLNKANEGEEWYLSSLTMNVADVHGWSAWSSILTIDDDLLQNISTHRWTHFNVDTISIQSITNLNSKRWTRNMLFGEFDRDVILTRFGLGERETKGKRENDPRARLPVSIP